MKLTGNLGLKKPEGTDVVNIDDLNQNFDILDVEVTKLATASEAGRMSAADKVKLDGIESGAQRNTVTSVNGKTGAVTLTSSDVGASPTGHTHTFAEVTNKPTTLSGYGITDAISSSQKGAANGVASLDGSAKVPTTQLPSASTSAPGIVQLNDTVSSTSTTQAATANVVKQVNDAVVAHSADYVKHPGYGVATGSANAYSVTLNPAPTSYVEGMAVSVKINVDNTGPSTININNLGAKAIKKPNGNDVSAGNLKAGSIYTLRYNGINFILQGEGGSGNAQPGDVLSGKTFTNDSGEQVGTMPNREAMTITPTTTDQVIPAGYHNGSGKVKGDANLIPANIKNGVSIFGITGTLSPLITYSNQNDNTQAPWLSNKYSNYSVRYKLLPDGGYYKVMKNGNNIVYETYNAAGTLLTSKVVVTLDANHSLRDIYDDCIYIHDSMNDRIKKYDYNGNLLQMSPSNSSLYSRVNQVSKEGFCDDSNSSQYRIFDMYGNILISIAENTTLNQTLWISPRVAILYINSSSSFYIASIKNDGSVQYRTYMTGVSSIQAALQTIFTQMEQFLRY
ncbi:tail fiber protein [Geobacillus stearothermophilus]|uniref:tail fiber protein n=1 Tax=Geobacillus stearothermophilus TaxID=1422 RepID=UPI001E476D3B|nr:tail fiber protein [Geobacillus stearothermophilus]MED4333312.1 phage tail protein [Geobacillus stearothermophilus]MED4995895.1 phage tail protein [Geobacillus stearothermophilus]